MEDDREIKDIKQHQQQLMVQVLQFTSDVASLKTSFENSTELAKEREKNFNDKMSAISINFNDKLTIAERNIKDVIATAVGSLSEDMKDVSDKVARHDEILDRITRVQEAQQVQMDAIQETLKDFKEIQKHVTEQESRLKNLEDAQRSEIEIRKEHIKGKWALITGVAAGILSIVGVILSVVLPLAH